MTVGVERWERPMSNSGYLRDEIMFIMNKPFVQSSIYWTISTINCRELLSELNRPAQKRFPKNKCFYFSHKLSLCVQDDVHGVSAGRAGESVRARALPWRVCEGRTRAQAQPVWIKSSGESRLGNWNRSERKKDFIWDIGSLLSLIADRSQYYLLKF